MLSTGRGFSRSHLTGNQDYSNRINTDADDVAALIKHVTASSTADEPAYVLGNSSGALVSLVFLSRHPELPTKVIAHEPPILTLLPEAEEINKGIQGIYQIYRAKGVLAALDVFAKAGGMDVSRLGLSSCFYALRRMKETFLHEVN
jgi:acetyltransferase/esterase